MSNEQAKSNYINFCISSFAEANRLSLLEAFNYLDRYKGIEFLDDCYEAEHLLSVEDAVADLKAVCKNNGGKML